MHSFWQNNWRYTDVICKVKVINLCFPLSLVPFRDSVLTKLLKNALGGNSKTIMVRMHFFEICCLLR